MNWNLVSIAAAVVGPGLIIASRKSSKPIFDAEQLTTTAFIGYFMLLAGGWGVSSLFFNASDTFFVMTLVPALMAIAAKTRGYQAKANTKPLPDWAAFALANFAVLLAIGVLKQFIVEPLRVPSSSMRPNLIVGDFILTSKFSYGIRLPFSNQVILPIGNPARGDVMVFRYPNDPTTNFVKRVIGLPGDTVEYREKRLTVNGKAVPTQSDGEYSYIGDSGRPTTSKQFLEQLGTHRYPTLNLPLNPTLNPLAVQDFPGREKNCKYSFEGFACTVPAGHYLALGDNRDESADSRYWGFVPEKYIVGRAFLIGWSIGDFKRLGHQIN
ncbi:signal peptidase I [Parachitinimonas caeni]|uniref:Signal peptidase I n=1 Tax=Parachitinimonas caeni TaxID=3031301 RepID=A0ABT7DVZ6_9NEIS|nr:signal peptidase I [Parachitinimonas caeni]MDK2124234.1 signal peptidase I [Parachitinimonas caeni]